MEEMDVWIIEDEKPAARLLSGMVKDLRPMWKVQVAGGSIAAVRQWMEDKPIPSLIFLDIQLSDGDAFSLLRQIDLKSWIIFTTAYDQYALEAFQLNSIDYLLKPVVPKRLLSAIEKFERIREFPDVEIRELWQKIRLLAGKGCDGPASPEGKDYRKRFLVGNGDESFVLKVEDVCLIQTAGKYAVAHQSGGKEYMIDSSLDCLVEQLDPDMFFRISRQYIINIHYVGSVESYFNHRAIVHMKQLENLKLVVSRDRLPAFRRWIDR